jgi:Ser/Thr protein kinase RdoA (MazF antagonist)
MVQPDARGGHAVSTFEAHRVLIEAAWKTRGDYRGIRQLVEISANVSTNGVYRVVLEDGAEVIAKASSYGSYLQFRQDHQLIHRWTELMQYTRYRHFLARVLLQDSQVFTYREGQHWVAFYEKVPFYDFLPRVLSDSQVEAFGREMAELHAACASITRHMDPTWKTFGSDVTSLFDLAGSQQWRQTHGLEDQVETLVRQHCEDCLSEADRLGYHGFQRIPVLVDWNIGNFSVGFDRDGFRLFSRWDYDWFRIEPRLLDFYFCARVVRSEGDQTVFSYTAEPLLDARFERFLRAYHEVFPLRAEELLFLKEAYRFFVLNYVLRIGEHFFRPAICRRLQRETVDSYLPALDDLSMEPLLRIL